MDHAPRLARLAGVQLAFVVALIHLLLGLRYWTLYAMGGNYLPPDVRVPLWTLSGLAMLSGVVAAYRGAPRRPLYVAGVGLMLVYILGYFSWHLGGHRAFFVVGDPALHDTSVVTFVVDHAFAGPVEFVALATETALLGVLGYLLYAERTGAAVRDPASEGQEATSRDE